MHRFCCLIPKSCIFLPRPIDLTFSPLANPNSRGKGGTFQVNNRRGRIAAGMKVSGRGGAAGVESKEGGNTKKATTTQNNSGRLQFSPLLLVYSKFKRRRETQLDRGRKWPPPEILGGLERAEKHGLRQELNANAIAYSNAEIFRRWIISASKLKPDEVGQVSLPCR